ncbi:hypothetical protein BKA10_001788 [Microbacterium invictum]|uniref:Uncharacterized protein n=1 Tax=Microbacterium invictum TaxID=515415 RepID=A0AA40VM23_9MICO|nr:hypothetical protein [Microbacterium invictum]
MTTEPTATPGALRTPRSQPPRPTLATSNHAPVVAKVPPPFSVRLSELFWILSLAAGAVGVVYMFIIRADQTAHIEERVRGVDATRADETVTATADIIYWSLFGALVAIVLLQILFLVSFANRRAGARWWLLGTLLLQAVVLVAMREFTSEEASADPLRLILLLQGGLAVVGLLWSLLRGALRWTARGIDVRRGPESFGAGGDL